MLSIHGLSETIIGRRPRKQSRRDFSFLPRKDFYVCVRGIFFEVTCSRFGRHLEGIIQTNIKQEFSKMNAKNMGMTDIQKEIEDNTEDEAIRMQRLNDYRKLFDAAMTLKQLNDTGRDSIRGIADIMQSANSLIESVKDPGQAILDAKVLSISSNVLKENAEAFDTNLYSFKSDIFRENVLSYLRDDTRLSQNKVTDWKKLASTAISCFKRAPCYTYLFGSFEVGTVAPPQRKARKQKEKQPEGNKKQPESVKTVRKEEDSIEETVHYIMNVLTAAYKQNNRKPISFIELILNPDSFGATVENMFHVSFLLKDGHVDIYLDENKLPLIAPVLKDEVLRRQKLEPRKQQIILNLTMELWEDLKQVYNIKKAMLKPRRNIAQ